MGQLSAVLPKLYTGAWSDAGAVCFFRGGIAHLHSADGLSAGRLLFSGMCGQSRDASRYSAAAAAPAFSDDHRIRDMFPAGADDSVSVICPDAGFFCGGMPSFPG